MGKELQSEFYNKIYKVGGPGEKYLKDYQDTPWAGIWRRVCEILRDNYAANILDIGCGPGQFACCALDFDFKSYIGIDFSKEAINIAKGCTKDADMSVSFFVKDMYKFDFNSVEYDAIVATEFLEHIAGDIEILSRIPSGTLIVATLPTKDSAGHVRHFPGSFSEEKKNIENRYKEIGDLLSFEAVNYANGKGHDYLFSIVKK